MKPITEGFLTPLQVVVLKEGLALLDLGLEGCWAKEPTAEGYLNSLQVVVLKEGLALLDLGLEGSQKLVLADVRSSLLFHQGKKELPYSESLSQNHQRLLRAVLQMKHWDHLLDLVSHHKLSSMLPIHWIRTWDLNIRRASLHLECHHLVENHHRFFSQSHRGQINPLSIELHTLTY